jgi:acyl-CoA thioester hydrolase
MSAAATIRLPLRWGDMDMLGHVNQAVYHELLEEGRGALVALLPGGEHFEFVLARVELDHRHEIRPEEREVEVTTRVERVGRTSMTVTQRITLLNGTVAADGTSVLVAWDPAARRSRELTDAERAALLGGAA